MALPAFTMRQLLEAGVHFGHSTRRWNPKMSPFLFGVRNGIHIIDLQQTVPLLHQAMTAVKDVVAAGGRVLFVGTKRQASTRISEAAKRCGQYYVNHRWLGGMMTNWQTISNSIKRLRILDDQLAGETVGLTKKELLGLTREQAKLERALGGIKEMGGLPDILIVIDTNKEGIAVAENIAGQTGIVNHAIIPSVVYTWPEIAGVGLTTEEAIEKMGGDKKAVKVGKFPMMANSRAKTNHEPEGFVKVIAEAETDRVLGVWAIASVAGTMIAQATQAMEFGATSEDIAYTCHAHPTHSEAMKEAAMAVQGKPIHI